MSSHLHFGARVIECLRFDITGEDRLNPAVAQRKTEFGVPHVNSKVQLLLHQFTHQGKLLGGPVFVIEARDAFVRAEVARKRHGTALAAQAAAAEAERIVAARFEQGVVKIIDLLDASTARLEAETRELMARAESHVADLRLAVRSGQAPETALIAVDENAGQVANKKEDER